MNQKPITDRLYQSFVSSFWLGIVCLVALIVLGVAAPQKEKAILTLAILWLITGPVWYVSLGMIAQRLGRRWLLWVVLPLVTAPFGSLVAFWLMHGHLKTARPTTTTTPTAKPPGAV